MTIIRLLFDKSEELRIYSFFLVWINVYIQYSERRRRIVKKVTRYVNLFHWLGVLKGGSFRFGKRQKRRRTHNTIWFTMQLQFYSNVWRFQWTGGRLTWALMRSFNEKHPACMRATKLIAVSQLIWHQIGRSRVPSASPVYHTTV